MVVIAYSEHHILNGGCHLTQNYKIFGKSKDYKCSILFDKQEFIGESICCFRQGFDKKLYPQSVYGR